MDNYLNKITLGDALSLIPQLEADSLHCCISDIPYGIGLDDWDVLHNNTNSALLGQSPAQKPLSILQFLIKLSTRERQIVLDPFAGSGSTAVACQSLNRQFIGFEINPDYVQIAKSRLSATADDNSSSPA